MEQVPCKCGCGLYINKYDKRGRNTYFVMGHQNKERAFSDSYWREKTKIVNQNAPVCKCGCGEKVLLSESAVRNYKGIPTFRAGHNGRKVRANINPTKEQEQIILGSILGDGSILYPHPKSKYPRLIINHGLPQKDYALVKAEALKSLGASVSERKNKGFGDTTVSITTSCLMCLVNVRELMYRGGTKIPNYGILNRLTPLGLAIWWMDDGSYKGNSGSLHTEGFSKEGNYMLSDFMLDKWGVSFVPTLDSARTLWYLRLRKSELDKWIKIIQPFVFNCMKFKVGEQ